MKIGNNLKKLRELRNYTQEHMAHGLEMSINGYGKIERDEVEVTLTKLDKIAELLDVTVNQILQFDGATVLNLHNSNYAHGNVQQQQVTNDEALKTLLAQQQELMLKVVGMIDRFGTV
jgi:transcriptional regulator with XRE-family HTH domain